MLHINVVDHVKFRLLDVTITIIITLEYVNASIMCYISILALCFRWQCGNIRIMF